MNPRRVALLPLAVVLVVLATGLAPALPQATASEPPTDLYEAIENNRVQRVKEIVRDRPDWNRPTSLNRTPLIVASRRGAAGIVRVLLDAGADPAARDRMGNTALMNAAGAGDDETVRILLRHGARVNVRNRNKHSPLTKALENDHARVARRLVRAGAELNQPSRMGLTPLMLAAENGGPELI